MATKIFDISVDALPGRLEGLDKYQAALFLVRRNGIPLGKLTLPVSAGKIDGRELRSAIYQSLGGSIALDVARAEFAEEEAPCADVTPTATVVICTRERPDDLVRCLEALMKLADDGQDILVVDNCPSTEATRAVVDRFPAVRYVREPRRGLDNARNCAIREGASEVLAFIDDDAVADPMWLRALLRPFADPDVQCVTGLTMPLELESEAQEMFETLTGFSRRGFTRRVFRSPPLSPLATGGIGAGANMAIRRRVVDRIGLFDDALDAGTASESGGDHEFFTRVLRAGYSIVYTPEAVNWHRHRRSWAELHKAMYGYGVGVYAAWTRSLLSEREWGVIPRAFKWFVYDQAPRLTRSLLRPSSTLPFDLLWAELRGCWVGPWAYLKARRTARLTSNG